MDLLREEDSMNDTLIVINVLSKDTYDDCHIDGSVNVPSDHLESYVKSFDKNRPIVVYCASYVCPASRNAWEFLKTLGFANVSAYEGGMAEWFQKGFPAQGACKADYISKVHVQPDQTGSIRIIGADDLLAMMKKNGLL